MRNRVLTLIQLSNSPCDMAAQVGLYRIHTTKKKKKKKKKKKNTRSILLKGSGQFVLDVLFDANIRAKPFSFPLDVNNCPSRVLLGEGREGVGSCLSILPNANP